jgi:hypothetical protein
MSSWFLLLFEVKMASVKALLRLFRLFVIGSGSQFSLRHVQPTSHGCSFFNQRRAPNSLQAFNYVHKNNITDILLRVGRSRRQLLLQYT